VIFTHTHTYTHSLRWTSSLRQEKSKYVDEGDDSLDLELLVHAEEPVRLVAEQPVDHLEECAVDCTCVKVLLGPLSGDEEA
jgi:hypothetical protein